MNIKQAIVGDKLRTWQTMGTERCLGNNAEAMPSLLPTRTDPRNIGVMAMMKYLSACAAGIKSV